MRNLVIGLILTLTLTFVASPSFAQDVNSHLKKYNRTLRMTFISAIYMCTQAIRLMAIPMVR